MKKRVLALVLTALLLAALLPTAAMAEEAYPLWVGGVQVTGENKGDILGDGTAKYEGDATGGTLTLTNANITGSYTDTSSVSSNIYVGTNLSLTIQLTGENKLSGADRGISSYAGDLTITGDGKLQSTGSNAGIATGGSKLEIRGAIVEAKGDTVGGIYSAGSVIISGDSVVTATGKEYAICAWYGEITLNDGLIVVEPAGAAPGKSSWIWKSILKDGEVQTSAKIGKPCTVTVATSANGTVTADKTTACRGDTVTLTLAPETGYALDTLTVKQGETDITPTKGNDTTYTFEMPAGDVTVTASFKPQKFTIKFVNDDGTELQSSEWEYGAMPKYKGATPTKEQDEQYTYAFKGWTPNVTAVKGEATYTATYDKTLRKYKITFVNDDGTELQSGEVEYGQTPAFEGETPTKEPDEQYTYTFKEWTPALEAVKGEATYTAAYDKTLRKYAVTFVSNGETFSSSEVEYGKTAAEPDDDPVRTGYIFDGWYADEDGKQIYDFDTVITGDTTIYAKWTQIKYSVVSGGSTVYTKNSGKELVITVKRTPGDDVCFIHFKSVQIDGKELTKDTDYTAKSGSTVITLKPTALAKLTSGNHTVTIVFDDGKVNTGLTIKAGSGGGGSGKSPQTGDDSNPALWIGLMALSGLGLGGAALIGKRRRES